MSDFSCQKFPILTHSCLNFFWTNFDFWISVLLHNGHILLDIEIEWIFAGQKTHHLVKSNNLSSFAIWRVMHFLATLVNYQFSSQKRKQRQKQRESPLSDLLINKKLSNFSSTFLIFQIYRMTYFLLWSKIYFLDKYWTFGIVCSNAFCVFSTK